MPDDPLDELDRNLGIATKLAALPILIDMLLGLLAGLLHSGCMALLFLGFFAALIIVNYPWISLGVVVLALAAAGREAWRRSRERPHGPRRGGLGRG
jgi:chromate transport protein ChrA